MSDKKKRGPSSASERAKNYFKQHPETSGPELAKRFKIDVTTVYRAKWWKEARNG